MSALGLLLLLAALVIMPSLWWLIDHRSREQELATASQNINRLQMLLAHRAEAVEGWAYDYSNWNLTADYLRGKYPDFIADNIYLDNLRSFDNDMVIIADKAMVLRAALTSPGYRRTIADSDNGLASAPADLVRSVLDLPRIRSLLDKDGSIGLYVPIDGTWYLIGAGSITYPDQSEDDTVYGVFVWVSELTPQRLEQIADSAGFGFTLLPPPFQTHQESSRISGDDIVTTRILNDTGGQASGGVRISYQRPFLTQMQDTRRLSIIAAAVIMLLVVMLAWFMLDRGIIRRLLGLGRGLDEMRAGSSKLLSARPQGDEIDQLAIGINALHIELSRANTRWQYAAQHDSLTNLGNRDLLQEMLRTHPSPKPAGLLLINLNAFRSINDLLGHEGADRVLQHVADTLRCNIPGDARAFRMAGDEFAVLFDPRGKRDLKALAKTLLASISQIPISAGEGMLSARIGAACTELSDMTADDLLQGANIALEHAQRNEHGNIGIYDASMLQALRRTHKIEYLLREALSNGEIEAWFQPIVSSSDYGLVRLEALARWTHPELGIVNPDEFITIAEQVGLAPQLDLWMLHKSIQALPKIRSLVRRARISVNVSARSLINEDYLRNAPRILSAAGLTGQDIILEITETALVDNDSMLEQPIHTLRTYGMRIQLDDFGVGYSSLSRLSQLDPAGIKLDGSFIRNRRNGGERICKAIIQLAQQLEIPITAEFVETDDDAEFLRINGCQYLQGFLFSRALPLPQLLEWIGSRLPQPLTTCGNSIITAPSAAAAKYGRA